MQDYIVSSMMEELDWKHLISEDDLFRNHYYLQNLPDKQVTCSLLVKSECVIAGLPYFFGTFQKLKSNLPELTRLIRENEGKNFSPKQEVFQFELPFNIALMGERLALNLLQRASGVATTTSKFVELAKNTNIKILDTRKTTPGLRSLEKYSVVVGGGHNHRFSQDDAYMIKDNHKSFFGGIKESADFFRAQSSFYKPIILEIHDLSEIEIAKEQNIKHLLLDNFSKEDIQKAISLKGPSMTYEVSGGVTLDNVKNYLIEGVDAISVGALTHSVKSADISFNIMA
jgi:nicotinate-nucleotide pyrophosphorylase (carboxylating)